MFAVAIFHIPIHVYLTSATKIINDILKICTRKAHMWGIMIAKFSADHTKSLNEVFCRLADRIHNKSVNESKDKTTSDVLKH